LEIPVELTGEDRRRLSEAFGGRDPDKVAKLIASAGFAELLEQATGRTVPNTMADLRALRIFCLISQGLDLAEAESYVGALFKVPALAAKRLVNSAVARYKVELQSSVTALIARLLDAAEWQASPPRWLVSIPTTFVRERILETLGQLALPDPSPAQRGPVWSFPDETYQALRKALGLKSRTKPKA